jgi:hypothetical protein
MLIKGVEIQKRGHVLEIEFEDEELKASVRIDFQEVQTQYGPYFIFAVANEGYYERKNIFVSAIQKVLPQIQDYLIVETGCDMSKTLIDHRSQLILA